MNDLRSETIKHSPIKRNGKTFRGFTQGSIKPHYKAERQGEVWYLDKIFVEVALWFHDIIYDPKKNDNEKMSSEYAKAFLESINLAPDVISKIEHLIALTKHPSCPETCDEKYIIDIDLAILGLNKEHYDSYESSIRKEYGFVPTILYKRGRKKIKRRFS